MPYKRGDLLETSWIDGFGLNFQPSLPPYICARPNRENSVHACRTRRKLISWAVVATLLLTESTVFWVDAQLVGSLRSLEVFRSTNLRTIPIN